MDLEKRLLEVQSASIVLSAELAALLQLLQTLSPHASEQFVRLRKLYTQAMLERIEDQQPALAARIQELLDAGCTHLPIDYDL